MLTQLPLVMAPQEYQSHPPPPRRRICDLPAEERPLYRLHQCGSNGLSTTELLSLLLGTAEAPGLAQDLLDHFDSLHGLARASQAQLLRIHGIGEAQAARRRLVQLLRQENGRPVLASTVIYQVQLGAYGRGFYSNDLTPVLQSIVAETFQAHGYCPTPEDGEYRPLPVSIASEAAGDITEKLAALTPVVIEFGSTLLLRDVLTAVIGRDQAISEWQTEQLVKNGRVSQALRQLGYQTELTWCQPYHFQPKLSGHDAQQVILKEVRVKNDPTRKLSLAKGLAVLTPALAIDDVDDTLIYLEMIGVKQSVKANWAALVGAGKVHWLGRKRIRLDGMKEHVKIQATLPCGWVNHILIHKQASLKAMNPEQPFYLLNDGKPPALSESKWPIPPLFYPMLNKCLALPLLPEWADYLWENGRLRNLITLLDEGEEQGYAAWRVLPSPKEWQTVIENGLSGRVLDF